MKQPTPNIFRTTGILLAAAVCLTLPIFYFGMPGGNDLPQHYRFAIAFYDALRSGDIYPVWIGDTNLGFGDVGVRFYPPLAYYVVAFFRFFVSSWNAALASAICFWFFVGGVGVYLLAREWFSEKASLAAALIFMIMPYHVNQVYNAGLFAEFAALAILPFCFLFVRRIVSGGGVGRLAGLSVAYALLILTHLPLSVIGSIGLLVFALVLQSAVGLELRTLGKLAISITVASAASAFYWVRMVSELEFVKHTLPQFTAQTYDFKLNFLASLLYVPAEQYEQTSAWFTDLLFVITLAMVLPSLLICVRPSAATDRRTLLPFIALVILVVVVGTPISAPLWEHIGLLQKIQFPWRFLALLSLAGSLLVAAFVEELPRIIQTGVRPAAVLAVGLIIAGTVFTFAQVIRPAAYPDRVAFENEFEHYRSDESYECWWPVWAKHDAFKDRERVSAPSRSVQIVKWTNAERIISVGEGDPEEIRVATFYYPFWRAKISDSDSLHFNVTPADDGTILVSVAGPTTFKLSFKEPPNERLAKLVSAITWLAMLAAAFAIALRRLTTPKIA